MGSTITDSLSVYFMNRYCFILFYWNGVNVHIQSCVWRNYAREWGKEREQQRNVKQKRRHGVIWLSFLLAFAFYTFKIPCCSQFVWVDCDDSAESRRQFANVMLQLYRAPTLDTKWILLALCFALFSVNKIAVRKKCFQRVVICRRNYIFLSLRITNNGTGAVTDASHWWNFPVNAPPTYQCGVHDKQKGQNVEREHRMLHTNSNRQFNFPLSCFCFCCGRYKNWFSLVRFVRGSESFERYIYVVWV